MNSPEFDQSVFNGTMAGILDSLQDEAEIAADFTRGELELA